MKKKYFFYRCLRNHCGFVTYRRFHPIFVHFRRKNEKTLINRQDTAVFLPRTTHNSSPCCSTTGRQDGWLAGCLVNVAAIDSFKTLSEERNFNLQLFHLGKSYTQYSSKLSSKREVLLLCIMLQSHIFRF